MMKRNFNVDMDIGYLDVPTTADPGCNDYKVGWGKRNLIGSDLVKNRATFVASNILPELDWSVFLQNLEGDTDMVVGAGWCDNLILDSLAPVDARAAVNKAAAGDRWRDLNPRIH